VDAIQKYEFDRQGFLRIPGLLTPAEVAELSEAIDWLEAHALQRLQNEPPTVTRGFDYYYDTEHGYHACEWTPSVRGGDLRGAQLMVEDFFNAHCGFDLLVDHGPTMDVIHDLVQERVRINNAELRVRYPGNATVTHFGGPCSPKYRYGFNANGIDCMMVRMIYFVQDVRHEQGPFSVVPGTHKGNYHSPYTDATVDTEPGMIGVEVEAGDGVIFTESLRHGGLTNHSEQTRKTLHVGYGPWWMMSQNIATMDELQHILPKTLERYTDAQRALWVLRHPELDA
jgi:hypothetical protein